MSRRPGFDVMDVDTSIANDPKFKRIMRLRPDHVAPAFMAYVALLGESWKSAERATIIDSWPVLIPFDDDVVKSMQTAELIDKTGRIPATAWRKRFTEANERRLKSRDRWARYNAKRPARNTNDDADTTSLPRGDDADTATSVPSVPTVPSVPSVPTAPSGGVSATDDDDLALHAYANFYPTPTRDAMRFVDSLVEEFGDARVAAAIGKASMDGRVNLLSRARTVLALGDRAAEKAKPKPPTKVHGPSEVDRMNDLQRRFTAEPTPEEIAAEVAAYKAGLVQ